MLVSGDPRWQFIFGGDDSLMEFCYTFSVSLVEAYDVEIYQNVEFGGPDAKI
jgi:hypothetical protein